MDAAGIIYVPITKSDFVAYDLPMFTYFEMLNILVAGRSLPATNTAKFASAIILLLLLVSLD
jgi:hypothetical protein